jgi:FkbM family methyltransferase
VFKQVFEDQEYGILGSSADEVTIIDGGANVGYTSVFLARRFPNAKIIAVEPDDENYRLLQQNVRKYPNITPINGAIWGTSGYVSMSQDSYRDGGDWAKTVSSLAGSVAAYTITDLLDQYGDHNQCIVKLDIEGAETMVFAEDPHPWLARCAKLIIEIHPDSTFGDPRPYINRALDSYQHAKEFKGELVLYSMITCSPVLDTT